MRRPSRLLVAAGCAFFVLATCAPVVAQKGAPGTGIIDDQRGRLQLGRRWIALTDHPALVAKEHGEPINGTNGRVWRWSTGFELHLDPSKRRIEAIVVRAPWRGATTKRIVIGSPERALRAAYPRLRPGAQGTLQADRVAFELSPAAAGAPRTVSAIILNRVRLPNDGDRKAKRPNRQDPPPTGDRGDGDRRGDRNKPRTRRPNQARVPPGGRLRDDRHRDDRNRSSRRGEHRVIWDRTWDATPDRRLVDAPTSGWPRNRGRLLVRIGATQGVRKIRQRFGHHDGESLDARDYLFDSDIVAERSRPRGAAWQFAFIGRGRGRVQIHWFDSDQSARGFLARNPYGRSFPAFERALVPAPTAAPDLLWEHQWTAHDRAQWISGPEADWDRQGVILVRVASGPSTEGVLLDVPGRGRRTLRAGDHVFEADEFIAPGRRIDNPLEVILGLGGRGRERIAFAIAGPGYAHVQVWWMPSRPACEAWCRANPAGAHRGDRTGRPLPLGWRWRGPARWRQRDDFEVDWHASRFEDIPGRINVAGARRGARITRSGFDPRASEGSEWDGGLWVSPPDHVAWTLSEFLSPARVDRIDIATVGSDRFAASIITIELHEFGGTWRRVAGFAHENVNWHRLGGGRTCISRPPVSIPVADGRTYDAARITICGAGPFRAGGIFVVGEDAGPPNWFWLREPIDAAPATVVTVPAGRGWIDTGRLVRSGDSVIIDAEGVWAIGPETSEFGLIGPEGYPRIAVRRRLGDDGWRRFTGALAAPDCSPGALIGRVGDRGRPFAVFPGATLIAPETGRLQLACNDASWNDNRGAVRVTIVGGQPGIEPVSDPAVATAPVVRFRGRLLDRDRRALPGIDVIVQSESWPRTVFGGGRTDASGRYDIEVSVPRGTPVVVRAPELRLESLPKAFDRPSTHEWSPVVR